ncbi:NAD(P)/FAD-dependent oxidoreductase [Brachybacterium sp. GCM10030267]|uniref:NAD(P)/FAD-dependent oxidoreductase n=1 Tax=unclassified Brachybacterium TaxID=2623841 RepID=UPI0036142E3B
MREAQHVIVGAGAHGLALASRLARRGESVLVLEAATIAAGASGGLGKRGVRANRRDIRELELARLAQEIWPGLAEDLGGDTGYVRSGGLYLREAESSGFASSLGASTVRAAHQNSAGIATELWDQQTTRSQLPTVTEDVLGASYCPHDGVASHEATTHLYAQDAIRHGAEILEASPVHSVRRDEAGRAVGLLLEDGTTVTAGSSVTLAANAGTNGLLSRSQLDELPLWPVYPQAVLAKAAHPTQIRYLVAHDGRPLSVKILEDDVVMLSGGWRGVRSEETGRGTVVPANVEGNLAQLARTFPGLGELSLLEADASRAETASLDGIPVIDTAPEAPNLFIAAGWSGHGWALVPAVAALLDQWLDSGQKPAELSPFSWTRFSRKEPTHV